MSVDLDRLFEEYAQILQERLGGSEEAALLRAYELGRHALASGAGAVDVAAAHTQALTGVLRSSASAEEAAHLAALGSDLLTEALAPFEMTLRGFREANDSLRELTGSLERQVADRTRDLEASLDRLRNAHHQRQQLLSRLVVAQEEERATVARDIHDDSIQVMTAAMIRLDLLVRRLEDPVLAAGVTKVRETVHAAVGRLRRLLFDLASPALESEGLAQALEEEIEELRSEMPGTSIELRASLTQEAPMAARTVMYRIAKEALINARKHAEPTHIEITVGDHDEGVRINIRDDGRGFDAAEEDLPAGHLGLTSMRERANLAGGWCRVRSTRGAGTTVEAWIPARGSPTSDG